MSPSPQNPKIVVPHERLLQLADIRDAFGHKSFSETIGELIIAFRDMNKIAHSIPGIEMRKVSDGLVLRFEAQEPVGLSFPAVRTLASAIHDYIADSKPRKTRISSVAHDFEVGGIGRAISVKVPTSAEPKQLAPDVAKEFADLLISTAA